ERAETPQGQAARRHQRRRCTWLLSCATEKPNRRTDAHGDLCGPPVEPGAPRTDGPATGNEHRLVHDPSGRPERERAGCPGHEPSPARTVALVVAIAVDRRGAHGRSRRAIRYRAPVRA